MTRQDEKLELELIPPPTEEELREAALLRRALEEGSEHPQADFCHQIRALHTPSTIDPKVHEALVRGALLHQRRVSRRKLAIAAFGSGTALALAAAVALVLFKGSLIQEQTSQSPLVRSRSTQALFDEPFPRQGGNTERIDRIALSRNKDFRSNYFEKLGVR